MAKLTAAIRGAQIKDEVAGSGLLWATDDIMVVNVDNSSIDIYSDMVRIAPSGITADNIPDGAISEPKLDMNNDPSAGQVLSWSASGFMQWSTASGVAGAVDFTDLTDTPSSYTGFAASGVKVTATEDGLEFYNIDQSEKYLDGTVTRDTNNRITQASRTTGTTYIFSRDNNYRVSSVTDSVRTWNFTRNSDGFITSWTVS